MKRDSYIPPACEALELAMGNHVLTSSGGGQQQIAPVWEDDYDEL